MNCLLTPHSGSPSPLRVGEINIEALRSRAGAGNGWRLSQTLRMRFAGEVPTAMGGNPDSMHARTRGQLSNMDIICSFPDFDFALSISPSWLVMTVCEAV